MSESIDAQIKQLVNTIAGLEAQRVVLGEGLVDTVIDTLRGELDKLEARRAGALFTQERPIPSNRDSSCE